MRGPGGAGGAAARGGRREAAGDLRRRPNSPSGGVSIARGRDGIESDDSEFDRLKLNDELYAELGLTPEELEQQQMLSASDFDPEGLDIGLDGIASVSDDLPPEVRAQVMNKDVYGPEVSVLHSIGSSLARS